MEILLIFLILPVITGLFARYYLKDTYTWQEFGCSVTITAVIVVSVYMAGTYHTMMDVEILNGEITAKERTHGSYIETYSCNCTTSRVGETSVTTCQTCTRTHYTVTWIAKSTVGKIVFDHLDSLSRSVYNSPDPKAYVDCYVGEPASQENTYLNYVKAVPTSLFNTATASEAHSVPAYPRVHSHYKVNRVINHGSNTDPNKLNALDSKLDEYLKKLGPIAQANVIAIFTGVKDPSFKHAVENSRIGGKKNDIVLFFGTDGDSILWVDVMTWVLNSGNEFLVAELKRRLQDIGTVDVDAIAEVTNTMVGSLYKRPRMEDYEYLKSDIKPSMTVILSCWILNIISVIGLTWWFHAKVDLGGRPRYNIYRRKFR